MLTMQPLPAFDTVFVSTVHSECVSTGGTSLASLCAAEADTLQGIQYEVRKDTSETRCRWITC